MASSLYDKYDHLTDDEKSYFKTHPRQTTKRFGTMDEMIK